MCFPFYFFFFQPHFHIEFVFPPSWLRPKCNRLLRSHRAQLRCPDDVSDDMCECGVPGGALNPNSTSYPDHGRCGDLPLEGKITTVEPGIQPGTSWLVNIIYDHQATRLVVLRESRVANISL
jgi:hypothetical protein